MTTSKLFDKEGQMGGEVNHDVITIIHGDCREVMARLAPESVHCVVTSPPY